MKHAQAALIACACVLSCSSHFRGGYARPEARLPGSKTLARFIPGHCEDATRAERTPRFSAVDVVETQTGRTVLLEHREGHELLVAENFREEGSYRVFEVIIEGERARRWRVPRSHGTGTLEVGRLLSEVAHGERFEAGLASSHLTCTLVPKDATSLR